MIHSAVVTEQNDQQLMYEAYSNVSGSPLLRTNSSFLFPFPSISNRLQFVQGLFELMDSVTDSAPVLIVLDKQAEFRVPAAVREIAGVVDSLLMQVIAVFPANTSYAQQTANQKSQVDTHFRQAVHSFHLATANTSSPYSNTTTV